MSITTNFYLDHMENEKQERIEAIEEAMDYFDKLDTETGSVASYQLARKLENVIKYLKNEL